MSKWTIWWRSTGKKVVIVAISMAITLLQPYAMGSGPKVELFAALVVLFHAALKALEVQAVRT